MKTNVVGLMMAIFCHFHMGSSARSPDAFNRDESSTDTVSHPALDRVGYDFSHSVDTVASKGDKTTNIIRSSPRDSLPRYLRNTDFETTVSEDAVAEWNIFREAFVDVDPALARSGNVSVRSSFLFGLAQDLLVPVSPYQSFAVAGYANREGAWEQAATRGSYFGILDEHLKDENVSSPIAAQPGTYGEFWTVQQVPAGAHRLSLFLRGQATQSWIRFDDLSTFTEQFRFYPGAGEEGWQLSDGSLTDSSSLILPAGSSASQRVVVGSENQSYFVWGRYETGTDSGLTVREQWLPRDASETTATTSTMHLLPAPGGTFVSDPGRLSGAATGMGKVIIEASTGDSVTLLSMRRGFAKVEPSILTAGPSSPDGSLKLTAAWPGHMTSATIQITGPNGIVSDMTTVTQFGSSVRGEWDPGNSPSGDYTARFTLEAADGESVVVSRPFRVVFENGGTSTIPPYIQPEFTRGIWLFQTGSISTSNTLATFESLRADGFDFAVVLATLNKLPDIRMAAELYDVPYVVFSPEAVNVFREYENRPWFSKADFIARMKSMFAPVRGTEHFKGIYVVDEPTLPTQIQTLRRAFLSLVQDGSLGTPFTVFLETITSDDFEHVQPPVGLVDVYPYNFDVGRAPTEELLLRIPTMNSHAKSLAALNRNLWILPQGFILRLNGNGVYPVPPSLHSAQLGAAVLAGARGYLPFFYSSGGTMEGLRTESLQTTAKLAPYQEFNAIVDRIGPLLMQLEVPELHPDPPYPFAVSQASGPDGEYLFVLNADEETTRTLGVGLQSIPTDNLWDVVAEKELPLDDNGNVLVELPPGRWALFAIGQNTVQALNAMPAPNPPVLSTIDFPVTHEFTATGFFGTGQPVRQLDFDNEGNTLAVTVPFVYAPSNPMIYNLQSDGTVTRESGAVSYLSERNEITDDGLYAVASPLVGLELYSADSLNAPPVAQWKGHTGGAYDVVRNGSTTWATLDLGIRQLQDSADGLVSTSVGWANRGNYYDLFGPFDDGSVSVVISNYGVSNIKPGRLDESQHHYTILNGVDQNADLNSNNLLAAPRHHLGVALFQLSNTGEAQIAGNIAIDALDACAVAWISNDLLAVVDGYKAIRFYRVVNGNGTLVEMWRPPTPGYFYMLSLAEANGRLAVGYHDGRVIVADVRKLLFTSPVADWQLYAE